MIPVEASVSLEANTIPDVVRESIQQALQGLRFGQITINVHDGQVVQIDRVVKLRQFRSPRQKS